MKATGRVNELSTTELIGELTSQVKLLAHKEVELAKAELKTQLAEELKMVKGLAIAAACALSGATMLLVASALALQTRMPAWAAALGIAVLVLLSGGILGARAYAQRVKTPMPNTIETLEDDLRWARNRLA